MSELSDAVFKKLSIPGGIARIVHDCSGLNNVWIDRSCRYRVVSQGLYMVVLD